MGTDDKEPTPTWQLEVESGTSHPSLGAGVWFVFDIILADGVSDHSLSGQLWLRLQLSFNRCVSSDHAREFSVPGRICENLLVLTLLSDLLDQM